MTRFRKSSRPLAAVSALALAAMACGQPASDAPAAAGTAAANDTAVLPRDISGVWAGPPLPTLKDPAPFTPAGQARFDGNKATWGPNAVGLADSNDPLITCDPLGFPRSMLYETRGFEFVHTAAKTVQLLQYQRVWREIWTDGRALPSTAPGSEPPEPRWFGYSIGRWEGDDTFVVETVGTDDRGWVDYFGRPHSAAAHFEERYRRVDAATLEVTVTVTDPDTYVRPYVAMQQIFQRANVQELEEQLCVPSEAIEYFRTVAAPAGAR